MIFLEAYADCSISSCVFLIKSAAAACKVVSTAVGGWRPILFLKVAYEGIFSFPSCNIYHFYLDLPHKIAEVSLCLTLFFLFIPMPSSVTPNKLNPEPLKSKIMLLFEPSLLGVQ